MPRVKILGFECSRCGHQWVPREGIEHPEVCPKCKSPYWDTPRRIDVKPEHQITCSRNKDQLTGKTVEYELVRNKKVLKGAGYFSVSDLEDGKMQIVIRPADESEDIVLVQSEADSIATHPGKYRFSCFVRA